MLLLLVLLLLFLDFHLLLFWFVVLLLLCTSKPRQVHFLAGSEVYAAAVAAHGNAAPLALAIGGALTTLDQLAVMALVPSNARLSTLLTLQVARLDKVVQAC